MKPAPDMFDKLKSLFGAKAAPSPTSFDPAAYQPYRQDELNLVYKLMFCDEAALFAQRESTLPLFGDNPDPQVIRAIAQDSDEESRVRLLAFHWLRERTYAVPPKEALGVVVEVPLENGLDVLAAYADGQVQYINQTGRLAVFEGSPAEVVQQAKALVQSTARGLAKNAGQEGGKLRRPPPAAGSLRVTVLAADGLHISEGSFAELHGKSASSAVLKQAQALLDLVVRQANG
ncbi:hypothetical protein [Massilia sp. erpn]|uniref:hypothetical protein n=1 Tax=Massilia sp. erpn TaxID=2738142 RepID=UPI00210214B1|nr:hypothetical protein [Massilia sp. erpn]UTY58126.1 hypothetical protein HPQ68_13595 [Massilia sp. erpn]